MSAGLDASAASTRGRARFELAWAALAIAALTVVFLWTPISRFGDSTYSPVDFMQELPLTQVAASWRPGNPMVSDVAVEYHPWLLFDRERLREGHLPTWNRLNGYGVPHLANFQSAVFSPLSIPFYICSLKLAALSTAFLKLFGLGFFTYLFLRRLRLAPVACAFGATVYMFAGHNVLRLGYTQSAVALMLPAGLWALERLAQRFSARLALRELRSRWFLARDPGAIAVFAAVLVIGLLLGNPETFYFALLVLVVYAALRGWSLWRDHRDEAGAARALFALGSQLLAVGVFSAGICAVQLLPFFEYLRESFVFGVRFDGGQTPLPASSWPCLMFPDLLGNPSAPYFVDYKLPAPDYDTVTMAFVGSLSLLFALLAVLVVRGRRALAFFALLTIAWVFYAYDLFGSQALFALIPSVELAPINRSQLIFGVGVAVCGAFFVDRCVDGTRRSSAVGALAVFAVALVVLAVFNAGAVQLALDTWAASGAIDARHLIPDGSAQHIRAASAWFLGGVACAAVAWFARDRRVRWLCGVACVLVAFGEQGLRFVHYNPTTPDAFVYPRTPLIEAVKSKVADERFVFLGRTPLPPQVNAVYGLESPAVWDGLDIRRFELLRRRFFSEGGNWRDVDWATRRGLELFGIERVLDTDEWIDVDTLCGFVPDLPEQEFLTQPIVEGADVELDFVGVDERLSALRLCFATEFHTLTHAIEVTVDDRTSGEHIAARTIQPTEFDAQKQARVFVDVPLPKIADARSRPLRLGVRSAGSVRDEAWSLVARHDWGWMTSLALWRHDGVLAPPDKTWHPLFEGWTARQGTRELEGSIVVDLNFGLHLFRESSRVGPYRVFEFENAVPRFHTVTRAFVAADEDDAWLAVQRKAFNPARDVVLDGIDRTATVMPAETPDVNEVVELLAEDHGRLRLRTMRAQPGWLVIDQPWYPGWRARVNGVATPIVHANFAFQAVKIGAGGSVVALDYEPASVVTGFWISLASLVALAAWLCASKLLPRYLSS